MKVIDMAKKIIWAIVELITIAIGTGVFVTSTLDSNEESAGIGAFMVVLGLLLKNWRKDLFSKQSTEVKIEDKKENKSSDKNLMFGVLLIFAFTLWGLN